MPLDAVPWAPPPNAWQDCVRSLAAGTVHLWHVTLDGDAAPFATVLDAEERARAGRFHFARDRERFVVARGTLRVLLGSYLGTEPRTVTLVANPWGKPGLASAHFLRFNMSHAGTLALIAVTRDLEIGVDVERLRPLDDLEQLVRRYFTPEEGGVVLRAPDESRVALFFECWTRKEALLKAWGRGMSLPLEKVDAALGFAPGARLPDDVNPGIEAGGWSIHRLAPAAGYVGAMAIAAPRARIEQWRWQGP